MRGGFYVTDDETGIGGVAQKTATPKASEQNYHQRYHGGLRHKPHDLLLPLQGHVMRGGREMDNHFEVMWDLFHSIPSIETEGVSVLDEYYWLNKEDPNCSLCRATVNRGQDAYTDGKFDVSDKAAMQIMKLFFTADEEL